MKWILPIICLIAMIGSWFAASWCFTYDHGYFGGSWIATSILAGVIGLVAVIAKN